MTQQGLQEDHRATSISLSKDWDSSGIPPEEIQEELRRILGSDPFQRSERLTLFLTHVVEKTLQGCSSELKEHSIGVEVCGRKSSYDSRTDPVVRVEARRLRSALALYYAQDGKNNPLRIALPKGGYVATFERRDEPAADTQRLSDLAAEGSAANPATRNAATPQYRRWRLWAVAAALLAIAGGAAAWKWGRPHSANASTLVLADFTNTTGDKIFDSTLRQGLAAQLEQSPYVSLLSDAQIAQTLALMDRPNDTRLSVDLAREVCERNGKTAVIDSSISMLGTHYIVNLRAIGCHNGELLAIAQTEAANKEHVLEALARSASSLRRKLGESLDSVQKYDAPPENVTTPSLEALEAYSLGFRVHVVKLDEMAAAQLFERAIALDPNFAMAYAREAVCLINLGEYDRATENLRKAYALRERVSEHESLFILSLYHEFVTGNLDEARKTYELRAQIYPNDDIPIGNAGNLYYQLGEYDKALAATQEAMRRNPGSRIWNGNLVSTYLALNRLPEAEAAADSARNRQLDSPWLHLCRYLIADLQGNTQAMAQEAAQLHGAAGFEDVLLDYQAQAAAQKGRLNEARGLSQRAAQLAQDNGQPDSAALYMAQGALNEAWMGNRTQAIALAHKALQLSANSDAVSVAAVALALAGRSSEALHLADDLGRRYPDGTLVQNRSIPTIRAAAALHSGTRIENPAAIVHQLEDAAPIDFGSSAIERVEFLTGYATYFRGEAYLAAHQGEAAAAEFQKILDHPQLTLTDPVAAMARLQLARACEMAGNPAKSAAVYKSFQSQWKSADPNLPLSTALLVSSTRR